MYTPFLINKIQNLAYQEQYMIFLDPKNDVAFKKIFGSEEHKNITISFLNSMLDLEGLDAIESVTFLNNEQLRQLHDRRNSILDILCVDQRNHRYIVEIQVNKVKEFEKRMVFYGAKTYSMQLVKGRSYVELVPVITLAIVNFVLFPKKERYKSTHHLLDITTYEHDLKELLFTFVELPKFNKNEKELKTAEDKWLYFLKNMGKLAEIPKPLDQDEFEEACFVAQRMKWSEDELSAYDDAFIRETDQQSMLEIAQEEGEARGVAKGIVESKIQVAKNMLACDISINVIASVTGLSIDEIEGLKKPILKTSHPNGHTK